MPLVRTAPSPSPPPKKAPRVSRKAELERLGSADAPARRAAARALSGVAAAAPALAARLADEADPSVREALFASLVAVGGAKAATLVAPFLKSDDAGLRGGALEALQLLDADAVPVVDDLLADADADLRILVVEVLRGWPGELATPRLQRLIEGDPHVNVCGAAVDVATEVGTDALLAPLAALRARFPGEGFLAFAIDIARTRIGGRQA
jgi:HEAT repeat protein